jgi:diguanylate cyclase (GGDEF)-like protein
MLSKNENNLPALRNIGRIIIFFGIFLLCLIWIGLYYKIQSERQLELGNIIKLTANMSRAFEEHTLRTVKSADLTVLFLKYQYEKEGRSIDIPRYKSEGRFIGQPFLQLGIIDENGDLAATNQAPYAPVSLKDRKHFRIHRDVDSGKVYISTPVLGRSSNKWSIQLTRRINKPDGQFGGVAVVSVDPFYFSEFYRQVDLGKNSVIVLIGRDGIVRARQSDTSTEIGQDLTRSVLTGKLAISDTGSYFAKSPVDGITRLYSYRALTDYPLIVSVGVDRDVALFAVEQRITEYYLFAWISSFVILAFTAILMSTAKRQERAEEGLRDARDKLEFDVEARTLELMAANSELEEFNQELEQEIAERIQVEEVLRQKEEELRTNTEKLSMAAELAHLGPWEYNLETDLFEFDDEFYAVYGTTVAREGRFMSPAVYAREFLHPDDVEIVAKEINKTDFLPDQFEHRIIRRDNEVRTIVVRRNIIRDSEGKIIKRYGTNQDITEQVQAEDALRQQAEMIRHMAFFDSLTNLPNRAQLNERLENELEQARRDGTSGVVLFIDLDDLKLVNDTYGHTYGDDIIIAAGNRIVGEVGGKAFVARIGGDEFIVVLPGETDRQQVADIATRIIKAVGGKHEIFGAHFHMAASIGIAIYPVDGDTGEEIIKNADNAMYAAKKEGKSCWRFYTEVMQTEAYEKMRLTNSLRYALDHGEFSLHYQPQLLVATGKVVGVEALLRWNSAEYGQVSPAQFIPVAEQSGLIHLIGEWVLQEACRFARRLADQGWEKIHVAVNISSRQLAADDFIAIVCGAIEKAGIEPQQLELEITESVLMASIEDATSKLAELKALGVRLSLDDFGTGYSSLTYLRVLPVKTLKIDKSFIDMITSDADMAEIIGSIIVMAHILDLTVVAEGVETEQQLAYLVGKGCDCIQGYIFGRPAPESETILFLAGLS